MKLYRIKQLFLGTELEEETTLGYLVAMSDGEVCNWINQNFFEGEWADMYEDQSLTEKDIMENRGDFETPFNLELTDTVVKYGWDEGKKITENEVKVLSKLGMLLE